MFQKINALHANLNVHVYFNNLIANRNEKHIYKKKMILYHITRIHAININRNY